MPSSRSLTLACLALCLVLAGCGGRAARPVAVTQSFDKDMTCAQIALEVDANKKRVNSLHKEDNDRHGRNAAVATMGVLLGGLPALMLIDDGEAQEKEINAYNARNNSLMQEAARDGCTEEQMAAAVAEGSAYTATAATTAAQGSPAAPSTNQVAVKPQPKADAGAAQAKFDAWYAGNVAELQQKLSQVIRDKALLRSCAAHTRPNRPVDIVDTTVVAEQADGVLVNISYIKVGDNSTCDESRVDAFLVTIENDRLVKVSYAGEAASPPAAATVASPSGPDPDVAAAQAAFDAWYAVNATDLRRKLNVTAMKEDFYGADCGSAEANITERRVVQRSEQGYVVDLKWWNPSKWNICERHRHDRFEVVIVNEELVDLVYIGAASASSGAAPAGSTQLPSEVRSDALAQGQLRWDAYFTQNREAFAQALLDELRRTDRHQVGRMANNVSVVIHSSEVVGAAGEDLAVLLAYDLWSATYWSSGVSEKETFVVTLSGDQVTSIQAQ